MSGSIFEGRRKKIQLFLIRGIVIGPTDNNKLKMKVSRSSEVRKWKCRRETRHIFFILAPPLVSLKGKSSLFWFSSIVWVGEISSYSPIGSSKILGGSPKGFSNSPIVREGSSQSSKKSEG